MRKTTAFISVALLCLVLALAGCDRHKGERAALLKQIADAKADVTRLNTQLATVSKDLESLPAEIKQYGESLQQHEQRRTRLQDELADFLLNHKMASVALMATAGGAATIIDENIDEDTKAALRLVGLIGVLYCVGNSDECADVAARVLYFGSQIKAEEQEIADATSKLSARKASLQARHKERGSLDGQLADRTNALNVLQQKHDALVCRFCF